MLVLCSQIKSTNIQERTSSSQFTGVVTIEDDSAVTEQLAAAVGTDAKRPKAVGFSSVMFKNRFILL